MSGDAAALLVSYLYVLLVIAAAELIRRRFRLGAGFTRKVVHVGVGVWIVPTLLLFDDWRLAIVPPLSFIVLNVLSYRFSLVRAMEAERGNNLGTILFPIAFITTIALFWPRGRPDAVAGGVLVLALGDAAAALVGRHFGQHRYRVGSSERSVEGSVAMVAVSFLALLIAAAWFQTSLSVFALAGIALLAGVLEAVSQRGFDNLIVPVGTSVAIYLAG